MEDDIASTIHQSLSSAGYRRYRRCAPRRGGGGGRGRGVADSGGGDYGGGDGGGCGGGACQAGASTLVHFSAQPQPFLVIEATASRHLSAKHETFFINGTFQIAHQKCSRQAEQWTRVAHTYYRGSAETWTSVSPWCEGGAGGRAWQILPSLRHKALV